MLRVELEGSDLVLSEQLPELSEETKTTAVARDFSLLATGAGSTTEELLQDLDLRIRARNVKVVSTSLQRDVPWTLHAERFDLLPL